MFSPEFGSINKISCAALASNYLVSLKITNKAIANAESRYFNSGVLFLVPALWEEKDYDELWRELVKKSNV